MAAALGVSRQTIANFEQGVSQPYPRTLDAIQQELERCGIEFTNGSGIGVRFDFAKVEAASAAEARTGDKD